MKIVIFSKILTKTIFCPNYEMILIKNVWNQICDRFLTIFVSTFSSFGQKQVLVKIFKKIGNKIQNAHSIWFPHRFSILRPKDTPKGPLDGPDPPVAVFEGQHVHVWVFFEIFFFPRHYYANSQVSMSALFEKVENGEVLSQSTAPPFCHH